MKAWGLFLFACLALCVQAAAESYMVNAPSGLNVRASSDEGSEVLGKLSYNEAIDVITIDKGWASIKWNNQYAYVNASYLTPMTTEEGIISSEQEESVLLISRFRLSDSV